MRRYLTTKGTDMLAHEYTAFKLGIDSLQNVFPQFKLTSGTIEAYFKGLSDVALPRVSRAILKAAGSLDRFPTINQLRTLAGAHDEKPVYFPHEPPVEAKRDGGLEARAEQLTTRAPLLYDDVLAKLHAHREMWQQRTDDMVTMVASPADGATLAKASMLGIQQILNAGQELYAEINGMVSLAILSGEAKPKLRDWTPEQREEGKHKLAEIRRGRPPVPPF